MTARPHVLLLSALGMGLMLCAVLAWPTVWAHQEQRDARGNVERLRVNRLTHVVQIRRPDGAWHEYVQEEGIVSEAASAEALRP